MTTWYLDLTGGTDANTGASFAQRVLTFNRAASLTVAGDTIRVMKSADPVATSKTAAWVQYADRITLSGAVNADISTGQSAWTASANVTCTASSTRKTGWRGSQIAVAAGFTTGLAAYEATGTIDLSGYQQISFWIMQTAGTLGAAASCSIKLCSDTAGATPVDTLNIPAIPALNVWVPVLVDKGSALGSAIQSVAFYVTTDNAAQTFIISNMVAVKASGNQDALHHKMFVGKANSVGGGGTDAETWYPIRFISGTTIGLDYHFDSTPASVGLTPACLNTSETVTLYTWTPTYASTSVSVVDNTGYFPGTSSSRITISGGWDAVAMSSQTGHTLYSAATGNSITFQLCGAFTTIERLHFARWSTASNVLIAGLIAGNLHIVGYGNNGVSISGQGGSATLTYSGSGGVTLSGVASTYNLAYDCRAQSGVNVGSTVTVTAGLAQFSTLQAGAVVIVNGVTYGGYETLSIKAKTDNLPSAAAGANGGLPVLSSSGTTLAYIISSVSGAVGSVTGSVGSVVGAVGSVTGNVGGNVVGSVGSVLGGVDTTSGTIKTLDALKTAILTTALTESYAADGAAPTLSQFCFMVWADLHEFSIVGTTMTARKLDKSTAAFTHTLDSATSPTSKTRAT